MTGTAATEADEFMDIYGLDVVEVPTNMDMIRARRGRRGLSHRAGEIPGHHRADQGSAEARPADAGRHHLHREIGNPVGAAEEGQGPAPGAERPLSRAGSAYHRPSRRARRGDHRHQHGRPRHRHSARRQPRHAARGLDRGRDRQGEQTADARTDRRTSATPSSRESRKKKDASARSRRPLRDRHRASREPAHRQPAPRPLGPPGRPRPLALLPLARRRSHAHLRLRSAWTACSRRSA